jgi:serine/threonine protein kinase
MGKAPDFLPDFTAPSESAPVTAPSPTKKENVPDTTRSPSVRPSSARRSMMPSLPPPPAPLFEIGDLVGGVYDVRAMIGSGGMGQVYDAHDRGLNRRVAIKVVLPQFDDAILRREGEALAAIRHPSVVNVFAYGLHEKTPYLVLERVNGISLEMHVEQRKRTREPFTELEVVDILIRLAEGLDVVHKAGLSHRDIKPANVMMAPGNRVVLMDFGLVLPQVDARAHKLIAGSLGYMSPEMLSGTVAPGEAHLVDLYALGVIGFELLTGDLPYEAAQPATMLGRQVLMPVPDVSTFRPQITPLLGTLIGELLAPTPRDRPQQAEAVVWQLRAVRERAEEASKEARVRVLVVDDDKDLWELVSLYVQSVFPDAEIEMVADGKHALRALKRRTPDILILDIGLPDIHGIELAMTVRGSETGDACKIISLSGGASDSDVRLLEQLGVSFIDKGALDELTNELAKLRKV